MSISRQSHPSARPNHRGITIILQNIDLSLFLEVKSWQLSIFSVRPIKSAISRHIVWSRPMLPALLAMKYIQRISHRNIVRQVFEGENPCDTWRATTLNKLRKKKGEMAVRRSTTKWIQTNEKQRGREGCRPRRSTAVWT